jgi:hypothetical protein
LASLSNRRKKPMKPLNKIMLWKRNGDLAAALKTQMDKAVARLAKSVQSIINDDSVSVENKNKMLATSLGQYLHHIGKLTKTPTLEAAVTVNKIFAEPSRKNLDVSVGEAGPDEGMPDERNQSDEDDEEADESSEQRARRAPKEKNMQTRKQEMRKLASLSPLQLCKRISADNDAYDLSEAQVHSVVQCVAKQYARPGESEGSAFLRLLSGRDEIANACNAALAVAKNASMPGGFAMAANIATRAALRKGGTLMPLEPLVTGGASAMDVNSDDSEPYQQLMAIAQRMHDASPELTLEQCFSRAFESPEHRALANKERAQAHARSMALGGGMVPI